MFKVEKPLFGPSHGFRVLMFVLANAVFIVLVLCGLWLRAAHEADALARDSAHKVLALMERSISQAEQHLDEVAPLAAMPCSAAGRKLQTIGALSPYMRSLFLIDTRQQVLFCASSVYRPQGLHIPLDQLIGELDPRKPHMLWRERSPMAPYRSIVVYRPLKNGRAVAAVLEGRNFEDVLALMRAPYIDRFTIDLPPLALENNRGNITLETLDHPTDLRVRLASSLYNIQVSIHARSGLIWMYARSRFLSALLAIALFMGVSFYLLWVRNSPAACLRRAVRDGIADYQFEPRYQPIVAADGSLQAVEVLIRWCVPLRGVLMPGEFIARATELQLLTPIMNSLLRRVETDMTAKPLPPGCKISINLSPAQLQDDAMLKSVYELHRYLRQLGYPLIVEITEEGLIGEVDAARRTLERLRAEDILVAIDDFGIGHSSLSSLRQLPFNYLKIDKSFVDGVPASGKDTTIVESVLQMARELQLQVVAEGVESAEQADYLRAAGVNYLQGYLFARPLSLDDLIRYQNS